MISLLFASIISSAPPPSLEETKRKIGAYETCVRTKALRFERARESVAATIDAAFAACKNDRAILWLALLEQQQARSDLTEKRKTASRERLLATLEASWRNELTADLMELRSTGR